MLKFLSLIVSFQMLLIPLNLAHAQGANDAPQTVEDISGNPNNLTDEQMYDASKFQHTGLSDRVAQETCEKELAAGNLQTCDFTQLNNGGLLSTLEDNMGKAYVLIFGSLSMMGGGGMLPTLKAGGEAAKEGAEAAGDAAGKKDKKTDVCMIAAMGFEMIMMLSQQQLDANTAQESSVIKDEQLKALVALKKNHENRAATSITQAGVYAGVTLCYLGYGTFGGTASDPMTWVKMGAAGLISTLYYLKWQKHKTAASAVQTIIDSLPSAGDCNPYTDTGCFCKEESSQELFMSEYQQVCVRKLPLADMQPDSLGCGVMVNNQVSFDKECKCKQTNTCFNAQVRAFDPKFGVANNVLSLANKGFDLAASDEFQPAKLANFSTEATAFATKSLKSVKKRPLNIKLNPQQAQEAQKLAKVLPPELAAALAVAPSGGPPAGGLGFGGGPSSNSLDKLKPELKEKVAKAIKANYNSSGSGDSGLKKASDEPGFQLPTFGQAAKKDGNDIVQLSEKAFKNADIHKSPETPIFDIISNRYRRSGWTKVESPEMKEAQ